MAELEEAVYSILATDAAVAALAEDRIYPQVVPQDAELPAVAYERISTRRVRAHGGPSQLARPRIQVTSTAGSYAGAKALAGAVRGALDGFMGTVNGVWVQGAWAEGEGDEYGETDGLYSVRQDFMIWHREAA